MDLVCAPTVSAARAGYMLAWYGFCLGFTKEKRMEQLLLMKELKPHCALVRNGREWRRFIETIPGYMLYLERYRQEELKE